MKNSQFETQNLRNHETLSGYCQQKGQAAVFAVLLVMSAMLSGTLGTVAIALKEIRVANENEFSRKAFYAAESGVEDVVYRTRRGKNVTSSFALTLNGASATTTVSDAGQVRTINAEGESNDRFRALFARLRESTSEVQFFYGIHVGDGGLAMSNNALVNGNVYSNGNIIGSNGAKITGDVVVGAGIGGNVTRLERVDVGNATTGTARAQQFVNASVHGAACPNLYTIVESPLHEELPIADETIQNWRDEAEAGGVCVPPVCSSSGDYRLDNGASGTLGPIKIPGNLTLDNNAQLTLTGTVFVAGNIVLSNYCIIVLSSSYQDNSGVLMTDGDAAVSNHCTFQGSGDPSSYVLLLSAKNSPASNVITIANNSEGVIYYASNGRISFSNNATAKEATAYGISLSNGATITYESGLANLNFSSGPAGGWAIESWQEIAP